MCVRVKKLISTHEYICRRFMRNRLSVVGRHVKANEKKRKKRLPIFRFAAANGSITEENVCKTFGRYRAATRQ